MNDYEGARTHTRDTNNYAKAGCTARVEEIQREIVILLLSLRGSERKVSSFSLPICVDKLPRSDAVIPIRPPPRRGYTSL